MLVHSGSRSLGGLILTNFLDEIKDKENKGALIDSPEFHSYMAGHNMALDFAKKNRYLIASRILSQIDSRKRSDSPYALSESDCIIDIFHNFVEPL